MVHLVSYPSRREAPDVGAFSGLWRIFNLFYIFGSLYLTRPFFTGLLYVGPRFRRQNAGDLGETMLEKL